jgi:hypothetical protein
MMALMLGALHKALLEAKVPDEVAREAAEEVAGFENRLASMEGDLKVIKALLGFVIALLLAVAAGVARLVMHA